MKILLAGFAKVKYMPYLQFYLENIDKEKNEVHLIYWNRDLEEEDLSSLDGVTLHELRCFQEDNVSHKSKIGSFLKYRKFVKSVLKQTKFDFVILLHSMPAVLLSNIWTKKFKNRYFFDYRDSTYERYSFYQHIISKLVVCSRATFTSSDGFRKFFPEDAQNKVYTTHNVLTESLSHRNYSKTPSKKIRLAFWGFLRNEDLNREIITKISRDSRFELHFYGREQQLALRLKEHAASLNSGNVFFHGAYTPPDRYEFAKNTDILHNVYNTSNTMLAMGNKYYDGPIFYIPQLCMNGSFMGKCAANAGIGFECDPYSEDFLDKVYEYYSSLDFDKFRRNCDSELDRILNQYGAAAREVHEAFE